LTSAEPSGGVEPEAPTSDTVPLPWPSSDVDPGVAPLLYVGTQASPAQLASVRQGLVKWVTGLGLPGNLVEDVVLAAYEGLINATEHAYTADPRRVDLVAGLMTDGRLLVTVRDYGRWRPPPADPGFRGRGLMMIHNLPDRAEVSASADGTVVQMEWNTRR
jgi:serine/threonine-protein kinase RsbW